jgi:ubiquinone/menaquinone biosynthesis C-methylase UbiE
VSDAQNIHLESQQLWDAKAEFWDSMMGEGNIFHRELVGPSTERLLNVQPGETVLDVACGNGQFSRRMAELGANVLATDYSAALLERARARTTQNADRIEYLQLDATNESEFRALGQQRFDAAVCNMALMDISTIEPLYRGLAAVLKPGGRFVFTLMHPCFNSSSSVLGVEEEDRDGQLIETLYVKTSNYLQMATRRGAGAPNEPNPHYYFHRPLHVLLNAAFEAGFMLDRIEEPSFSLESKGSRALSWVNYKAIPPVLAVRLRLT